MSPAHRRVLVAGAGLGLLGILAVLVLAVAGVLASRADPEVRQATVVLPDWPEGRVPVAVALLSDLHVGNLSTDPRRLARVVAQVNALHPELVLITGDFAPGHHALPTQGLANNLYPLAGLKAPLGVVAVLGNHDHQVNPAGVRSVLAALGVAVLDNQAMEKGPLAIGGLDDPVTGFSRLEPTMRSLRALPGAKVLLSHTPQIIDELPADIHLLLAGHTHCGQIGLLLVERRLRRRPYYRYDCGLVRDPDRITVVSAGIGTSVLPIRFGSPPDLWLLTLRGPTMAQGR